MHVGFVDTQYYNFFLCILPIAELQAHEARVSVAPYLRKCGNLPIRENLVIKWPYARLSSPTHFIGWLFVGLIYCTLDLRLFLANSNKINPNNGTNQKFLMSLCYYSFSTDASLHKDGLSVLEWLKKTMQLAVFAETS